MGPQLLTLEAVNVESGVSAFDGKAFCRIECKGTEGDVMIGQLDPDTCRSMAVQWIEAADAAEFDAILLDFLINTIGLDNQSVGNILVEMRKRRGEAEGEGGEQEGGGVEWPI